MITNAKAAGIQRSDLVGEILSVLGPIALFPVWGAALAVATPGYYYRRRNQCYVCCHGVSGKIERPISRYQQKVITL
jgi:hypothetical protein